MKASSRRSFALVAPLYRRLFWRACSRPVQRLAGMSQAYCRAAVRWSLVDEPQGDHDWFWDRDIGSANARPAR